MVYPMSKYKKGEKIKISDNFTSGEFDCKCNEESCRHTLVSPVLVRNLQRLRNIVDKPLHINSGYRCILHNKKVGGKEKSKHLLGIAADVACPEGMKYDDFLRYCESIVEFTGIGVYKNKNFVHLDVRDSKERITWNG